LGGGSNADPWNGAQGWLTAFDVSKGKEMWKYHSSKPMIGGVIATGGALEFTGELNGDFQTFNAKTGGVLYTHNVGGPIGGGLITYTAGGKPRFAVVPGSVGLYNTMAPELDGSNPTVTVFALN
jgi:alcohol dehydrogenase (cytochrome c)